MSSFPLCFSSSLTDGRAFAMLGLGDIVSLVDMTCGLIPRHPYKSLGMRLAYHIAELLTLKYVKCTKWVVDEGRMTGD